MIGLFLDVFLIAAGTFIGSFITASSRAWPDWKQIATGRSACSECGQKLGPAELIPLVSYLLQRGKCRSCGTAIPVLHPIGEVIALIIPVMAVLAFDGWPALAASLFGWVLLFGALVDARTLLIPDVVSLGLIPPGLALSYWAGGIDGLMLSALAGAIGFTAFIAIRLAHRLLRGQEGLGIGDAKLMAAGGVWAGPFALPWIVLIGAGLTLLYALGLRLLGKEVSGQTQIPLGPGLAAGCYLAYCLPVLMQTAV